MSSVQGEGRGPVEILPLSQTKPCCTDGSTPTPAIRYKSSICCRPQLTHQHGLAHLPALGREVHAIDRHNHREAHRTPREVMSKSQQLSQGTERAVMCWLKNHKSTRPLPSFPQDRGGTDTIMTNPIPSTSYHWAST